MDRLKEIKKRNAVTKKLLNRHNGFIKREIHPLDIDWLIRIAEAAQASRDAEDNYTIRDCQSETSFNKMEKAAHKLDNVLGEEG